MCLSGSFPLSASQINVELGRSAGAAFDIQGASERGLANIPSGAISMSDFLGKCNQAASYIEEDALGPNGTTPSATINIGVADGQRRVVAVIHWVEGGVHFSLNSATIGGVAATIHVQRGHTGGATGLGVAIISAIVPTGTTATLATSFSGGVGPVAAGIWRLRGYNTIVDSGSAQAQTTTAPLTITNLATVALGVVIAGHTGSTNTHSVAVTWTNVTSRYDVDNSERLSGADANVSAGTITVGSSQGVISNAGVDLVAVSFGA